MCDIFIFVIFNIEGNKYFNNEDYPKHFIVERIELLDSMKVPLSELISHLTSLVKQIADN